MFVVMKREYRSTRFEDIELCRSFNTLEEAEKEVHYLSELEWDYSHWVEEIQKDPATLPMLSKSHGVLLFRGYDRYGEESYTTSAGNTVSSYDITWK